MMNNTNKKKIKIIQTIHTLKGWNDATYKQLA